MTDTTAGQLLSRTVGVALVLGGSVLGLALSLGPMGAFGHVRSFLEGVCVTLPHVVSDVASAVLIAVTTTVIAAGLLAVASSLLLARQVQMSTRLPVDVALRARVRKLGSDLGFTGPILVFAQVEPVAYTTGLVSPAVWISTGAVSMLDDDELQAVLAHEIHHCSRRDPLAFQLLGLLATTLFVFPVVRALVDAHRRAAEFEADRAAALVVGSEPVARALLRFTPTNVRPGLAHFSAVATVGERVQTLLGAADTRVVGLSRSLAWTCAMVLLIGTCALTVAQLPHM